MGASPIISKMRQLLTSNDKDLVISTIKVTRALKLKDAGIIKALKKHLESEDHQLQLLAIDSIGDLGGKEAGQLLFDIFKKKINLRLQIGKSLSQIGDPIIPLLKKEYKEHKNDRMYKKSLISIISKIKTFKSIQFLLNCLYETDLEILKHVCYEIRNPLSAIDKKGMPALVKELNAHLKEAKTKKLSNALVSLVIIIGYTKDPKFEKPLLTYLDPKFPFVLRRNTLFAIERLGLTGKGHETLVKALLPLLEDHHFSAVTRSISAILEKVSFGKIYQKKMIKLVESRNFEVKKLAMSKIAQIESKEVVTLLLNHLFDKNYDIRTAAEKALQKMPSSTTYLFPLLIKKDKPEEINAIGKILAYHKGKVTPLRLKEIFKLMNKSMAKWEDEKTQSYFNILRQINPDFIHSTFIKESASYRKKKKYKQAIQLLELLSKTTVYTKEVKWELMLNYLLSSELQLSSVERNRDKALFIIQGCLKSGDKDVLKKIKKEKALSMEHLYYIGFHFSEKLFELKEFGVSLLKSMIKKSPRNKYSINAKKRLQSVGEASKILSK